MGTEEILDEINKLSVNQRLILIELTIKNLRQEDKQNKLLTGADKLFHDYTHDTELTSFNILGQEDFYEAR